MTDRQERALAQQERAALKARGLEARNKRIRELIAQGGSNTAIARAMGCDHRTVRELREAGGR